MTFDESIQKRLLEGALKAEGFKVSYLSWKSDIGKGLDDFLESTSEINVSVNQSQPLDSFPRPEIIYSSSDLVVLRNLKETVPPGVPLEVLR